MRAPTTSTRSRISVEVVLMTASRNPFDYRLPPQSSLGVDTFAVALETLPADDWNRTWAADRTMMLRMTSKRVKNAVDNLCPPTIVVMLSQEELLDKYQIYNARPAFAAKHILCWRT